MLHEYLICFRLVFSLRFNPSRWFRLSKTVRGKIKQNSRYYKRKPSLWTRKKAIITNLYHRFVCGRPACAWAYMAGEPGRPTLQRSKNGRDVRYRPASAVPSDRSSRGICWTTSPFPLCWCRRRALKMAMATAPFGRYRATATGSEGADRCCRCRGVGTSASRPSAPQAVPSLVRQSRPSPASYQTIPASSKNGRHQFNIRLPYPNDIKNRAKSWMTALENFVSTQVAHHFHFDKCFFAKFIFLFQMERICFIFV